MDDQFRRPFGPGVHVRPTQWLVFSISIHGLSVVVALVARHDNDRARTIAQTQDVEKVGYAHHVRLKRFDRQGVGAPDERLCSEVEDEIRIALFHDLGQCGSIAHVPPGRVCIQKQDLGRRIEMGLYLAVGRIPSLSLRDDEAKG